MATFARTNAAAVAAVSIPRDSTYSIFFLRNFNKAAVFIYAFRFVQEKSLIMVLRLTLKIDCFIFVLSQNTVNGFSDVRLAEYRSIAFLFPRSCTKG